MLLFTCNKVFCTTAYSLCSEFNIYAIDALYLKVALENNSILVSLDKEEFINKINSKKVRN